MLHPDSLASRLHAWLTAFAKPYGLKAQLELSTIKLYLIVGSASLGRCELAGIETKELTTWESLELWLEQNRKGFEAAVSEHLVRVRTVEGEIEDYDNQ